MSKQLRKTVMLILAVVILAAAPLNAFANESPEDSMETALIAVKRLINLDDDVFTDFSYYSGYTNYQTREGLIWTFQWSDMQNGYVYASATADGILLDYRMYDFGAGYFGFAEVSRETAVATADDFIRAASPATYTYYKAPTDVSININSRDYRLSYTAEVNGRLFNAASINVQVDKFTGVVTGYSTTNVNPGNFKFEEASPIISESAAISAYAEKIGLTLEYRSNFNWREGTVTVFPAYLFNSSGDRYIGAKAGDVLELIYDRGLGGVNDEMSMDMSSPAPEAAAGADFSRQNLTPAEIAALERVSGFLNGDQALQKLIEIMEIADLNVNSFDERNVSLRRDYYDRERYFYDIFLYKWDGMDGMSEDEVTNISGRVDAETGRVVSFNYGYRYRPYTWEEVPAVSVQQAEATVDAFLKRHAPAELAKSKIDSESSSMEVPMPRWGGDYRFQYIRYENDTRFRDNGISVSVDPNTGKIMSYSLNWYENVTFPSVSNVLTPERALTAYVADSGSSVYYITVGDGNAALVYDFGGWNLIDPFTGKAIDYSGEPMTEGPAAEPAYDDVKGHWSEHFVTRLLDNGVSLWGGAFEPDKTVTQEEFLRYIIQIDPSSPITPQAFFADRGISIDADPNVILTKQDAARIIVEYLGYGRLARQSEWYVYPFNDDVGDDFRGFVTIAYILGIIGGDNNGNFNAGSNVTRSHAAVMLYNLILARS